MAALRVITDDQIRHFLSQGMTITEIAKRCNLTKGAISQRVKKLSEEAKQNVNKDLVVRSAPEFVDNKLDAMSQLRRINDSILGELNHIETEIQLTTGKKRKFWTEQRLKHVAEIRCQLSLLLEVARTFYNADEVAAFTQIVLEEIGRESQECQQRILQRLNERCPVAGISQCG